MKKFDNFISIVICVDVINILFLGNAQIMRIFLIIYILELVIKSVVLKFQYVNTKMFYFDFFIILTSSVSYIRIFKFVKILRLLKYLRLIKIFKIGDSKLLNSMKYVITSNKKELEFCLFFLAVIFILSSYLVVKFEKPVQPDVFSSFTDGLWWTFTTISTVGYGDKFPITVEGQILTVIITIFGVAIFTIPGSIFVVSLLNKSSEKTIDYKLEEVNRMYDKGIITENELKELRITLVKDHVDC